MAPGRCHRRGNALVDLKLRFLERHPVKSQRMAVAVRPDGVARFVDAPDHVREIVRHLADQEERCLHAFVIKRVEYLGGARRQRAVVKTDDDLVVFEREAFVVLHGAEPWMLGGIDDQRPARAEGVGIAWAFSSSGGGRRHNT
jgi:hypothetical protein